MTLDKKLAINLGVGLLVGGLAMSCGGALLFTVGNFDKNAQKIPAFLTRSLGTALTGSGIVIISLSLISK